MNKFPPIISAYKGFYNEFQLLTWKSAKWGILIFCFVHFLFEIGTGNEKNMILPVIFNYFISAWYVKKMIKRDRFSNNPILWGMAVSCVVFLIRVILGMIYSSLLI